MTEKDMMETEDMGRQNKTKLCLIVVFWLLLNQFESARTLHTHGTTVAVQWQTSLHAEIPFDVPRYQQTGSLLPLVKHLLGSKHLCKFVINTQVRTSTFIMNYMFLSIWVHLYDMRHNVTWYCYNFIQYRMQQHIKNKLKQSLGLLAVLKFELIDCKLMFTIFIRFLLKNCCKENDIIPVFINYAKICCYIGQTEVSC